MRFNTLIATLALAMIPSSFAQYMGGPCSGGLPGACMDIKDCMRRMEGIKSDSYYFPGYCPGLPKDVVCCQLGVHPPHVKHY